jgi:hypothetical protein
MEGACEVAIRPLYVGRQIKEMMAAKERGPASASAVAAGNDEHKDAASSNSSSHSDSPDDASGDENNDRLPFLHRYYQFTGPLVNRPYGACMDKLEAMFRAVMASFRRFDVSAEQQARMDALLEKHVEEYTGADGRPARGIPFERMINAFRDMTAPSASSDREEEGEAGGGGVLHTFTDAELYELVAAFTTNSSGSSGNNAAGGGPNAQGGGYGGGRGGVGGGAGQFHHGSHPSSHSHQLGRGGGGGGGGGADDRVSLSNEGHISKADFMSHWRASLERSLPLRRIPREILSGAFVTQALQHMGLLPPPPPPVSLPAIGFSASAAAAAAAAMMDDAAQLSFLPVHFAMQEPPLEGWPASSAADGSATTSSAAAAAAVKQKSQREREQERQVRAALREQDARRWAHLPSLAPPPPPGVAAAASASRSASSARAAGASHAAIAVARDADDDIEGLAVLHVHAHGAARVGVEHRLPPPPPLPDHKREEEAAKARA